MNFDKVLVCVVVGLITSFWVWFSPVWQLAVLLLSVAFMFVLLYYLVEYLEHTQDRRRDGFKAVFASMRTFGVIGVLSYPAAVLIYGAVLAHPELFGTPNVFDVLANRPEPGAFTRLGCLGAVGFMGYDSLLIQRRRQRNNH